MVSRGVLELRRPYATYKQVFKVLVPLHTSFEDSLGIVETAWKALQAKEHFSRSSRAVNAAIRSVTPG